MKALQRRIQQIMAALKQLNDEESGQALVEYILMVVVAVMLAGIIATGFRRSLMALWQSFTNNIAAACPGCPPDSAWRLSR